MSVEDEIAREIREANNGAIVTGYVIVIQAADPTGEDNTYFNYQAAGGQSVALSLGLLDMGHHYFTRQVGNADDAHR